MSYEENMDPELRPGLEIFEQLGFREQRLDAETIPGLRAGQVAAFAAMAASLPERPGIDKEDRSAPGPQGAPEVPVRIYRPAGVASPAACLYWIHGGGMIMGGLDTEDMICEDHAERTGCTVISVDYRLPPEHPHPAPIEDCYAGLAWTAAAAKEIGIDPGRIAVGGSSAGGGLAASVALMARDRGGPQIAFQLLVYPMLDDRCGTPSASEFPGVMSWSTEHNQCGWAALLQGAEGGDDVSPYAAAARAEDLSGLPPALVQVGELDTLRDEGINYAARLAVAGVTTELHLYPGVYHGADVFVPTAAVSIRMHDEFVGALRRALRVGEQVPAGDSAT